MTGEIVYKPWGFEAIWARNTKYVGKILHINAGHRLSLQYHEVKDETIYVLEGTLNLEVNYDKLTMQPGESYRIKPTVVHRFGAGSADVKLVEVSTPELSDVVRVEDDYGREK